jgi:putative aminopeptidase FrvX
MSILTIDILRQLSETPGGPGDEDAIRDIIARVQPKRVCEVGSGIGHLISNPP